MSNEILTADQWQRRLSKAEREKKEFKLKMEDLRSIEDLRDEVVSHLRNSPYSYQAIENLGGPIVQTLEAWTTGETKQPRLNTMRAALRCIGKDFYVGDRADVSVAATSAKRTLAGAGYGRPRKRDRPTAPASGL